MEWEDVMYMTEGWTEWGKRERERVEMLLSRSIWPLLSLCEGIWVLFTFHRGYYPLISVALEGSELPQEPVKSSAHLAAELKQPNLF